MWLLINVKSVEDVGKDEKRRIFVKDRMLKISDKILCAVQFKGDGFDVHPATPGSEKKDD